MGFVKLNEKQYEIEFGHFSVLSAQFSYNKAPKIKATNQIRRSYKTYLNSLTELFHDFGSCISLILKFECLKNDIVALPSENRFRVSSHKKYFNRHFYVLPFSYNFSYS